MYDLLNNCYESVRDKSLKQLMQKFNTCRYEDIEDAISEAFLKYINNVHSIEQYSETSLNSWIIKTASRILLNQIKKNTLIKIHYIDEIDECELPCEISSDDEINTEIADIAQFIKNLLKDFPNKKRRFLEYIFIERLSDKEIYAMMHFRNMESFIKYKYRAYVDMKHSIIYFFTGRKPEGYRY